MGKVVPLSRASRVLVVTAEHNGFVVRLRPARTHLERSAVTWWESHGKALGYARGISKAFPAVYPAVSDESGAA